MIANEMLLTNCGDSQIVYFPFRRLAFKANEQAVGVLQKILLDEENFEVNTGKYPELKDILDKIVNSKLYNHSHASDINYNSLIILLNFKCNFTCSYCYSSQGRSNIEISNENLKIALDDFITHISAKKLKKIRVSFLGGGEPTLSWNDIVWVYTYLHRSLGDMGVKILMSITTNGSLLNDDYLLWILQHGIHINLSFEILPDIQNSQRGCYDKVEDNIRKMHQLGINFSIRSTITEQNVLRMEEMVDKVLINYPNIKKLHFEPVTGGNVSKIFYSDFIKYFFRAQRLANQKNIQLICSVMKSFSSLRTRFCRGEYCLTPDGKYTMCHRSSSPLEPNFNRFYYGQIANGEVYLDREKMKQIYSENVFEYRSCCSCIAKWHCAGGCLFQRLNYSDAEMINVCNFTKRMISLLLLEKIDIFEFEKIIYSNKIII